MKPEQQNSGLKMYQLATELFPICRSLTGAGVRETLARLKQELPALSIHEVPSGTKCLDWEVPLEWNICDAYILDESGKKVLDFQKNNLHVVGYSTPIDQEITFEELDKHLFSLPEQPNAIPYITSYYKPFWGFCMRHADRAKLSGNSFKVKIASRLEPGNLTYGELLIPGESTEEIFLSTYVCHPSMANNELSGPVLVTELAKWVAQQANRKFSYRIIFVPETIGAIVYISKQLATLKKNMRAGFQVSCVGDNRAYSYLPSRAENSLADRVALHVLKHAIGDFKKYSFLDRGSDERQYCSPGVDLPVCSVMRTKYGEYPEYHTSLDDLSLISPEGLQGAFNIYQEMLLALESNRKYQVQCLGEPQLGKRGLYPNLSSKDSYVGSVADMMNFLAYCDGAHDLLTIAEKIHVPVWKLLPIAKKLLAAELIKEI